MASADTTTATTTTTATMTRNVPSSGDSVTSLDHHHEGIPVDSSLRRMSEHTLTLLDTLVDEVNELVDLDNDDDDDDDDYNGRDAQKRKHLTTKGKKRQSKQADRPQQQSGNATSTVSNSNANGKPRAPKKKLSLGQTLQALDQKDEDEKQQLNVNSTTNEVEQQQENQHHHDHHDHDDNDTITTTHTINTHNDDDDILSEDGSITKEMKHLRHVQKTIQQDMMNSQDLVNALEHLQSCPKSPLYNTVLSLEDQRIIHRILSSSMNTGDEEENQEEQKLIWYIIPFIWIITICILCFVISVLYYHFNDNEEL
eukprot:CAMPEP_0119570620 /NCGR_PEP_ID=MMETSP1352-20130426/43700_1 /TAXON_ID=265584 /ORGANISM="Stauroneis constricta, Strain CCMP1120" /LENGTH=311 /DNA_ID=CAMNT_0007620289 /DNA_START=139 /DNA_END=1074 /DNA_ORIENTATION=+